MANCTICDKKLGFTNKPTFGFGKLMDGNELCLDCFKKVSSKDVRIANNLKKHTRDQIIDILSAVSEDLNKLDTIKEKIKSLGVDGFSKFLGRKEINALPEILLEGEDLENIVQGTYEKKQGILVATNRRLIFIDVGILYGSRVEDFPYDKISSLQYETGFLTGKITVMASGNKAVIDQVSKFNIKPFADYVRSKILNSGLTNNPVPIMPIDNSVDVASQIKKFAELKDLGILTEEEFQNKKTQLLQL